MATKTMAAWAKDAYEFVQGACNLSGVVFAFERLTNDLREAGELRADHPCVVLWVDKMDDLARSRRMAAVPADDFDSAIVSLVAVMRRICDDESVKGTDERNQHPDVQAAVAAIATMAGSRDAMAFGDAYTQAETMAAT